MPHPCHPVLHPIFDMIQASKSLPPCPSLESDAQFQRHGFQNLKFVFPPEAFYVLTWFLRGRSPWLAAFYLRLGLMQPQHGCIEKSPVDSVVVQEAQIGVPFFCVLNPTDHPPDCSMKKGYRWFIIKIDIDTTKKRDPIAVNILFFELIMNRNSESEIVLKHAQTLLSKINTHLLELKLGRVSYL